ncbi:FG-GAP-like repeat-containing protein [Hymenobacter terricola]|uniref:FG-GAP-like repeat-containing protein n=1 Tax=Hymenobacter terricola TaxID=2819236 RepID=UPI001B3160C6|nr:FG-GAP-like repeat-containing protein [Hymenobacter terricola]
MTLLRLSHLGSSAAPRWAGGLTVALLAGLAAPAGAQTAGRIGDMNMAPAGVAQAANQVAAPPIPMAVPAPTVRRDILSGPTVTALAPTRNLRNTPRPGNVAATFSEALANTAATQGALKVYSAQRGGKVAGTAVVSGSTLTFDPSTDFQAGETVSATITTGVQGASGNLAQPQVFQFIAAVGGGSANLSTPAATSEVTTGAQSFNLASGDVDGDGDLDLLVPATGGNSVSIRLNNGLNSTNFVAPATNSQVSVVNTPRTVVLGDIDGDGDLDMVATSNFGGNSVSVRVNNGSGVFSAPASTPEVTVGNWPLTAALGDVDGDGDLDLLVGNNNDNTVSVRINSGLNSGAFVTPATGATVSIAAFPLGMAIGDVDGDGDLDFFTASYGGGTGNTVSLRLNNGNGVFSAPAVGAEITVGIAPVQVAVGDVDADGDLDMVTCNYYSNTISVRLNNGSGTFLTPAANAEVGVGTNPEHVALADVNGDGYLDLLSADQNSNGVSIRLNNGSGVFAAPATNAQVSVGSQPSGLAVGDLDGDGDMDFATGNYGSANTSIRLNQGSPDLVVSTPQNVSGTYNNVTVTSTGVATLTGLLTVATTLTVQPGGTLNTACQALTGPGTFTLQGGATLGICDPAGISTSGATGAVQLMGARSFSPDASYTYNGTAAQVTGSGLPPQVRNLTTTNANSVTLSAPVNIAQVVTVGGAGALALNVQRLVLLSSAAGTALLVNSGTGVVTGSTGVQQRYIDGSGNPAGIGYRQFASPTAGSTVADLTTPGFAPSVNSGYNTSLAPLAFTPFPNVFSYDESRLANAATGIAVFDKGWQSPGSTADPMPFGKGFTVNIANSAVVDFEGQFGQGNGTITGIVRSNPIPAAGPTDQTGWNLIGNPYPSPLDWGTVSSASRPNVEGAVYVFQSTSQYGGVYHSFVNGVGAGTGLIAAGQAFFVRASTAGTAGSIALTNANRQTTFAGQPVFQRSTSTNPQVQLTLSNAAATLTDQVYVYATTGATAAFDGNFDAHKLPNTTGLNVAALASNSEALSVQGLAPLSTADVVVPLRVDVPAAGTYSLQAAQLVNIPTGTTAYLRDAQTGAAIDLAQQPSYSFSIGMAGSGTRFSLLLTQGRALAVASAALARQIGVYPNPAHAAVAIELPAVLRQQATTVTLLNPLGQRLRTFTLPATGSAEARTLPLAGLAPGMYLVSLATAQGVVVKQLVIE